MLLKYDIIYILEWDLHCFFYPYRSLEPKQILFYCLTDWLYL